MMVPPRVGSSSGISVKSGFRWTWGTLGLRRLLKPLMKPKTSTRRWLARTTAPWMVAFRAGVSPPAVRMPIRFMSLRSGACGPRDPCRARLYGLGCRPERRYRGSFTMTRIERPLKAAHGWPRRGPERTGSLEEQDRQPQAHEPAGRGTPPRVRSRSRRRPRRTPGSSSPGRGARVAPRGVAHQHVGADVPDRVEAAHDPDRRPGATSDDVAATASAATRAARPRRRGRRRSRRACARREAVTARVKTPTPPTRARAQLRRPPHQEEERAPERGCPGSPRSGSRKREPPSVTQTPPSSKVRPMASDAAAR